MQRSRIGFRSCFWVGVAFLAIACSKAGPPPASAGVMDGAANEPVTIQETAATSAPQEPAWLPCGQYAVLPADGSDVAPVFDSNLEAFAKEIGKASRGSILNRKMLSTTTWNFYEYPMNGKTAYIRKEDVADSCPVEGTKIITAFLVLAPGNLNSSRYSPNESCKLPAGTLLKLAGYQVNSNDPYARLELSEAVAGCDLMQGFLYRQGTLLSLFYFGTPSPGMLSIKALQDEAAEKLAAVAAGSAKFCDFDERSVFLGGRRAYSAPDLEQRLRALKIFKDQGICDAERSGRCSMDEQAIYLDNNRIHLEADVDKRVRALKVIREKGLCTLGLNARCSSDETNVLLDGKKIYESADIDDRLRVISSLTKASICQKDFAPRCSMDGLHVYRDGKILATAADVYDRINRLLKLIEEGHCQ